ncbi:MAG: isochorismatase family protein [Proteobacteria bacterium]|nr:isochorismatase family protein [Pseudomonadota bacterium]
MMPNFDDCALLIIDMQEKLLSAIPEDVRKQIIRNTDILIELAKENKSSIFYTEQNPAKLGHTIPELADKLKDAIRVEKMCFSCMNEPDFCDRVCPHIPQSLIIVGIEAHICVLMTAIDLIAEDEDEELGIYVPVDAIASRTKANWKNAVMQMSNFGVVTTNTETLVFQSLEEAGTEAFRKFSKLIK